jgi:hypothetical protein
MNNIESWTVYKLTDKNLQTYGGYQWQVGVPASASGIGELCGPGWLHAYPDPLVGLFLNPIHSAFESPLLWVATGAGKRLDEQGLKLGVTTLTLQRQLSVPVISTEQRVRFAIAVAWPRSTPKWRKWAEAWLDGSDRSKSASAAVTGVTGAAAATAARAAGAAASAVARAAGAAAATAAARAAGADIPRCAVWAMGKNTIVP